MNEKKRYGLDFRVSGITMLFVKQFPDGVAYSVSEGYKNEDGEYENIWYPVYFESDAILPKENTKININKAYKGLFSKGKKKGQPYIKVQEFEVVGQTAPQGFAMVEEDIPF